MPPHGAKMGLEGGSTQASATEALLLPGPRVEDRREPCPHMAPRWASTEGSFAQTAPCQTDRSAVSGQIADARHFRARAAQRQKEGLLELLCFTFFCFPNATDAATTTDAHTSSSVPYSLLFSRLVVLSNCCLAAVLPGTPRTTWTTSSASATLASSWSYSRRAAAP